MATSQEFQKHLSNGNLGEAMKLALSEMIELRISTRVVSEDGLVDDRPGHQIQTRINIVDGDIENEIGSLFLKDGPYSELRSFHGQQVAEAQQIIRTNIESLQTLLSLFFQGHSRPSGQSQSAGGSEQFAEVSDQIDLTHSGLSASAVNTAAVSTAAVSTAAVGVGIAGAGIAGAGIAGVEVAGVPIAETSSLGMTIVDFGQFEESEPLDSVEPIALTEDAEEPEGFGNFMDGEGNWDEPEEELDLGAEPLAALVEPLTDSEDLAEGVLTDGWDAAGLEPLESESPLDFNAEGEVVEDSFESSFGQTADLGWDSEEGTADSSLALGEDSLALDPDSEIADSEIAGFEIEDSEIAGSEIADSEIEDSEIAGSEIEDSESQGFALLDLEEASESAESAEPFAFSEMEVDPDDASETDLEEGFDFAGDLSPEVSLSDDIPLAMDDLEAEAEPFSFAETEDEGTGLDFSGADDSFALPDFEEPIEDLYALDIPEDFPDPLADLSFNPLATALDFEPEEDFALGDQVDVPEDLSEVELTEVELTEDEALGDEALGDEASGPAHFSEEELVTEHDLSAFATQPSQTSEAWNFETIEPSPNFSLEGTGAIEEDFGTSFVEMGSDLEQLELAEDSEMENSTGDFLMDDRFDLMAGDESESLVAVGDFSSLDDDLLDSPPSDRDLEESFADDLDGEMLADLSSLSGPEEPQTFEEWEGISTEAIPDASVPALEAVDTLASLEEDEPIQSLDDLDAEGWDEVVTAEESPVLSGLDAGGLDAGGLDDSWEDTDDFDDLDDMALSPEELGSSDSLHFAQEEPLVGDAMGLADVDAMDSLFQNSETDFDFEAPTGTSDLDPFLDLDDPFDDVQDSEDDPFAELDLDDSPMFPPPPPRPPR